jgi:penicillin amidase
MDATHVPTRVAGLSNDVLIRRDRRGIPYIEAQNEPDLCFAFGFTVAGDRLWQMELLRRTAYGQLAEILGPDFLQEDYQFRRYGFAGLCGQILAALPEPVRHTLQWFASGVNARINSLDTATLPLEFHILNFRPQPWNAQDGIAVGKVLAESMSSHWMSDIMRASFADLPPASRAVLLQNNSPLDLLIVGHDEVALTAAQTARLTVAPPSVRLDSQSNNRLLEMVLSRERSLKRIGMRPAGLKAASNNWVVSGKLTHSGKPLLANDPHLDASVPCVWYLAHLSAPGLRVAGATIPGLPSILIGHNDYCAWGFTNLGGDEQDLYRETFSPSDPQVYRTPNGWEQAVLRNERIAVKEASGETSFRQLPVLVTRHGPIVFDDGNFLYALRWTAFDRDATELVSIHGLNRAGNSGEVDGALAAYRGPTMNCVWANRDGDIGYHLVGKIPERQDDDGSAPYDGATERGRWSGYVPFDELPNVTNPESGIIVTANNRIVGESYPHFITHGWDGPYRARRIWNLLNGAKDLDIERMIAIQRDTYSFGEVIFAEVIVKAARAHPGVPEWDELLALFNGWDGRAKADSHEMPFASAMRLAFSRAVIEDKLGPDRTRGYWWWPNRENFIDYVLREKPSTWLPKAFASWDELFLSVYRGVIAELEKKNGPDRTLWTWARTSEPIRFEHPLAQSDSVFLIDPMPRHTGGSENPTVNRGEWVSMRLVTSLANWDETRQGLTLGQSGDPSSPHWKDQLPDWADGTAEIFPFTRDAIAETTKIVQALVADASENSKQGRSKMGVGAAFGKVLGEVHGAPGAGHVGELTLKDVKLSDARRFLSGVGAEGSLDFLGELDPSTPLGNIKVKDIQGLVTGLAQSPGASAGSFTGGTPAEATAAFMPMPMPMPMPRPTKTMAMFPAAETSSGAPGGAAAAAPDSSTGVAPAQAVSAIMPMPMPMPRPTKSLALFPTAETAGAGGGAAAASAAGAGGGAAGASAVASKEMALMSASAPGPAPGAASSPNPILALVLGAKDLQDLTDRQKDIVLNKLLAEVAGDSTIIVALKAKITAILAELRAP